MQTFITNRPEFGWGVAQLDQKRLVKQLLEARQIMSALAGDTKGWLNHPATKMWRGKEDLLYKYSVAVALEMSERKYTYENNLFTISTTYSSILNDKVAPTNKRFSLHDLSRIIYTHRGRLYEKDPEHYWYWHIYSDYKKHVCCERCNYYWPTHLKQATI